MVKKNIRILQKNKIVLLDSQYINSDPDDELIHSDADSNDDFQKELDFGINLVRLEEILSL
jgi:hypothetical protein